MSMRTGTRSHLAVECSGGLLIARLIVQVGERVVYDQLGCCCTATASAWMIALTRGVLDFEATSFSALSR